MTAARSPHRPPERAGAATPCRLAPLALVALLALSACPRDRTPLPKGPPPDYETPRGYDAPGLDGPATASLPDPGDLPPPPPAPAPAAPPGSASAAPAAATASAPAPAPSGTGLAASHAVPDPSQAPAPFGTPGRATPVGTAPVPAPAETKQLP